MTTQKDPRRALKESDGLVQIASYKNGDTVYDYADKALRDPPLDWWVWPLAILGLLAVVAILVVR